MITTFFFIKKIAKNIDTVYASLSVISKTLNQINKL